MTFSGRAFKHLTKYPLFQAHWRLSPLQAEEVRRVADSELGFQQVALNRSTQAKTFLFVNTERMVVGCLVAEHIHQVKKERIVHFSDRDLMNTDICGFFRLTESWSYQKNRKTWRRMTSWRDTGPGAAPLSPSQLSVGSAGSGCSAWPGGGASPLACWTPSGSFTLVNIPTNHCQLVTRCFLTRICNTQFRPFIHFVCLGIFRSTFVFGSYLTKEEIAFSDPTPDGKLFATKYCNTPTFLVYNFVEWRCEDFSTDECLFRFNSS